MTNLATPNNHNIFALQMCSGLNADDNIAELKKALNTLPATRPLLVCLPEAFLVFSKSGHDTLLIAKHIEQNKEQYEYNRSPSTAPIVNKSR